MNEQWRSVADFKGFYEVSDQGRVRSLIRETRRGRRGGKILKPRPCGKYFSVTLHRVGIKREVYLHTLVLESFVGPRPDGYEACHDPDPNPANCRLENLRWDTRQANRSDTAAHGTQPRGEDHRCAKLKEADIHEMFRLKRAGLTQSAIALRFGISPSQASLIFLRKEWRHLEIEEAA